ncbi:MAG: TonB-dependent receptor plug domain-containing protein, partial [Bdellovibrionales bacterium]|nr:TonB-dependent receptor plug domain-containing protein [Bdellovibrionales bacterium]
MKHSYFIFIFVIFSSIVCGAQETPADTSSEATSSAEAPDPKDDVEAPKPKIEKIEVTGSHIKRIDVEGPTPLLVIDNDDLLRSGYNSVSDVLRDAGVSSFGSFREVGGQQGAGTSAVDLRGLGQVRTLILLDGQRMPTDAIRGSEDMNMLPM